MPKSPKSVNFSYYYKQNPTQQCIEAMSTTEELLLNNSNNYNAYLESLPQHDPLSFYCSEKSKTCTLYIINKNGTRELLSNECSGTKEYKFLPEL